MSLTFDTTRFQARLAAAAAALRPSLADRLPLAATDLLLRTAYLEPIDPETQAADVGAVLTDIEFTSDTAAQIGIVQLDDWLLAEGANHCQDCLDLAAGGPYTAAFTVQPNDGTTICSQGGKHLCHCQRVPREPDFATEAPAVLTQLGADVRGDLAAAWRGA